MRLNNTVRALNVALAVSLVAPVVAMSAPQVRVQVPDFARKSIKVGKTRGVSLDGAWQKYEANDYAAALEECNKVLEKEPKNLEALCVRALAYFGLGELEKGLNDLDTCLSLDNEYELAWIILAAFDAEAGDMFGATNSYKRAWKIYDKKHLTEASNAVKAKVPQVSRLAKTRHITQLKRGTRLQGLSTLKQKVAKAKSKFRGAQEESWALIDAAAVKAEAGDLNGALADIEQAIQKDPQNAYAIYVRGVIKISMGNADGIADIIASLELDALNPDAWVALAEVYQAGGDNANALACYQNAYDILVLLGLDEDASWVMAKIIEMQQAGQAVATSNGVTSKKEAISAIATPKMLFSLVEYKKRSKTLKGQPRHESSEVETLIDSAMAKGDAGDLQGALVDIEKALTLDPKNPNALFIRGAIRYMLGNIEGALADVTATLSLDPENPWAWYLRGELFEKGGDYTNALTAYQKACDIFALQNLDSMVVTIKEKIDAIKLATAGTKSKKEATGKK